MHVREENSNTDDFLLLQFMYIYYYNLCHKPVLNLFYNQIVYANYCVEIVQMFRALGRGKGRKR
jgi:hypothetical protein